MGVMDVALVFFAAGLVVVAWVFFWSRQRKSPGQAYETPVYGMEQVMQEVPQAEAGDAVLVSRQHGKLIYVNGTARQWLGMNGGDPNLEIIARQAEPTDSFLELFAHEGQASFQLGSRWVQASSHRVPGDVELRTFVVMRELNGSNNGGGSSFDLATAMNMINEIGETVDSTGGLENALQLLLMILKKAIPFDAGEINIYDRRSNALEPRGWVGDAAYLVMLAEAGGMYFTGEGLTGWIARHRKPIFYRAGDPTTTVRPKIATNPYLSLIGVPLSLGDELIGTLELGTMSPHGFSQSDLALLQAVSKSVTVAIYNTQLYTEQVRRIEDISTIQQVISVEAPGDDSPVYQNLTRRVAELVDAEMCGVLLYDEGRGALVPALPFHNLQDAVARMVTIPMPPDSPQRDIWEKQPYWVAVDIVDNELVEVLGLMDVVQLAGVRNTIWLPMEIGSRRIGVLTVSNKRGGNFSPRDIQTLRVVAAQAAVVVENIRLYSREQRLDAELDGLQEITYALSVLDHENEFFAEITQRIAQLMDVAMCGILLLDEDRQALVARLPFYGVDNALIADYHIPLQPGTVFEELWTEEDGWYTNKVSRDSLVYAANLQDLAQQIGVQQTMVAVLNTGGRRLGIVQISNRHDGRDFDDSDLRRLSIFATQTATLLENTRLFREVQRSSEETERLRRLAEHAGAIVSSDDSLMDLLAEVADLTDSGMAYITVLDRMGRLVSYPHWTYGFDLDEAVVYDTTRPGFEYSVALSRRPFLTNDSASDLRVIPDYRQVAMRFGIHSAVMVPLIVGDRVVGELGIANRNGRYTPEDIPRLQSIGAQVAAAIDRLLRFEETDQNLTRRLEELDAIARVSTEMTGTLEFEPVLNAIRKESLRTTGAQGCTVVLLRPPDQWKNPAVPEMDYRLGNARVMTEIASIELEAINRRTDSVLIADYSAGNMAALPPDARSAVAAGIVYVDRVIGVIHLYHDQPNTFDDRAAAFLVQLATKASLAYGNSTRFKEQQDRSEGLRRRVEQLNRIFELSHMLHSNVDPIDILEAVAYSVQGSVGFDSVLMLLADIDSHTLVRKAHAGLPLDVFESTQDRTISLDRLEDVLDNRYRMSEESYFLPVDEVDQWYDRQVDALSAAFDGNRTIEVVNNRTWRDGDMLLVRLTGSAGNLIGLMSLDRPFDNQRPDRSTVEVLEIFAHQASTTLENTRLYMASVRNAETETRLNTLMESLSSTLDVGQIVESMIRGAPNLLDFDRATVAIRDSERAGFNLYRTIRQPDGSLKMDQLRRPNLTRTVLGRSYEDRQTHTYRRDTMEAETYEDLNAWQQQGETIGMVLPLMTGGDCFGAMHIGTNSEDIYPFVQAQPLVKRMGQLLAGAVQNARLFDQAVNLRVLNESVVESIQQGIVVLDQSGRIISINQFIRDRYGWKDSAVGRDLFSYQPDLEFLSIDLREVLEYGVPRERINQNTTDRSGAALVRNFYLYPLRYEDSVRGSVLLVEDVTERALLEQQMESRANQLAALTEVSKRITSSLEREDVVNLGLSEMEWLQPYDTMSIWRRNGSYMVMEGANGDPNLDMEAGEVRVRISDYARVRMLVDNQRVVTVSSDTPLEDPLPGDGEARSWMGVPQVNQGHVVGMLVLTRKSAHAYENKADQDIAFAFASQVAIALANADLFQQTFDRTNELGILLEAAQATSMTQDINQVFRVVVDLLFSALDMDQCAITIWDEVENALEVAIEVNRGGDNTNVHAKGTSFPLAQHPAYRQALNDRDVVVILHDDPDTPHKDVQQALIDKGHAARMLVPLIGSEGSIGLVILEQHSVDHRQMTQQKVRLARALGNQVAVAIQNARLSNEMAMMFEESFIINELTQALSSTLDLNEMIKTVRHRLPDVVGANDAYLALYKPDSGMIEFPMAVRSGQDYPIEPRPLGTDEVSFVIKNRRMLSIDADYFDPNELRRTMGISNGEGEIKSFMAVPLTGENIVFGVLALRDTERTRAFDLNDQRVLTTVAAQLSAALQNARLFEQVSSFADELEQQVRERTEELETERDRIDTLYQITSELASTLDMERLQQRALGMVVKAMNADDGLILSLDPRTDSLMPVAMLNPDAFMAFSESNMSLSHPAEGLGMWLLQNDHDVVIEDLHEFEHWDRTAPGAEVWRSAVAVVLESSESDPQGVMVVFSREPGVFDEPQLRLMIAAGSQVAAALNNADLYALIRDQAERLGMLLRAAQEEGEKNSAILESIADGVVLTDQSGRVVLFNTAAERILQLPRDQVIGQPLGNFTGFYGSDAQVWAQLIQSQSENLEQYIGAPFVEERLSLGDRIVSAQLSPVYSNDSFLGMVSVFRDITKDVEVDRMKSEFVSNVSHELRTPLTPIKGYTDLLMIGAAGEVNDMQKRILQTIKDNVDRLTILVEDVLDISKIDAGRERLKIEIVDLRSTFENVLEKLHERPQHANRDLKVSIAVPDDVPKIEADPDKLNRIIANIVDNAFNYTMDGGSIEVGANLRPDGRQVLISVSDTGVGIPESFREDVWRRFQRYEEHALRLEVAGTGLGLSIVKEMVEMHGGDVWFESQVDQGTTFFVLLPVEQPQYLKQSRLPAESDDTRAEPHPMED